MTIKESIRKVLSEETEENEQKVMNFLLRRFSTFEKDLGEGGHPSM